ncbi:MAG TPA: hypothetical protein VNO30_18600 [Kofleriaceae bacterium]|nr:hypothetical protein [Kofleriaceae bacterium]
MRSAGPAKLLLAAVAAVAAVAAIAVAPGADTRAVAEPRSRIPPFSVWVGSYTCPQGLTSLRLSIEAKRSGEAVATFEFGPHPDNPKLPRGEYRMTGAVRLLSRGQLHVKLVPERWITQPDGWSMTGLTATSDLEQQTLEGRIDAPACGELSVRREGAS